MASLFFDKTIFVLNVIPCYLKKKMESFSVAKLCVFLVCWIRYCISDKASDSEPNLYWKRALWEFESRYESLVVDLKSEIENRKESEAKLVDEINKLEHNRKATEEKFADEIKELKHLRLRDIDEISQLKSELELTKKEVGTQKLRFGECEALISEPNVKFDSNINLVYPEEIPQVQNESIPIDEHTYEPSNGDMLQSDPEHDFPHNRKETVAENGSFQRIFIPPKPGNTANVQTHNEKMRKARGIPLHSIA